MKKKVKAPKLKELDKDKVEEIKKNLKTIGASRSYLARNTNKFSWWAIGLNIALGYSLAEVTHFWQFPVILVLYILGGSFCIEATNYGKFLLRNSISDVLNIINKA